MTIFNKQKGAVRTRQSSSGGFTLVEMMITVVLLALVLASIVPTFAFFSKSITSLGNYSTMSRESRSALEVIARDLHVAEDVTAASATSVGLLLPNDAGAATVTYAYDSTAKTLVRTIQYPGESARSEILFNDMSRFRFVYYNRMGVDVTASASVLPQAKSVQVDAKLVKKVITKDTSDYIISARFLMRNI